MTSHNQSGTHVALVDEFAAHIDDGTACEEFLIDAEYPDGWERVM